MNENIGNGETNNLINVIFLVNDYYINNIITVYNEMKKNPKFNVIVFVVDFIDLGGSIKNSSSNVRNYLENEGIESIDFNNYDGTYKDLEDYNPSYVFYMTPYDIYYPHKYRPEVVCKYAKLCHIAYGANIIKDEGNYSFLKTNPFFDICSFVFVEDSNNYPYRKKILKTVGLIKIDDYLYYSKRNIKKNTKRKRIAWKPRWTLEDGESNYWKYVYAIYDYVNKHKEIDFYMFYHELFDRKVKEKNCIKDFEKINDKLIKLDNYYSCSYSNFLDDIWCADIFIADFSSSIVEYSRTGKPILFCESESIKLNDMGKKIYDNSYKISNEKELIDCLEMLLNGQDPLKKKREKESKEYFYAPKESTPTLELLKVLVDDYEGGK